jgi:putative ABC transport system permease protein
MFALALRDLGTRKVRTILTSIAIVLGVMMISGTYILTDTIDKSFDEIFTEANEGIDAVVTSKPAVEGLDDAPDPAIPASTLDKVRATDGVEEAAGGIFSENAAIIDKDGDPLGSGGAPTFAASVVPERFDALDYPDGRKPTADSEVVIDKNSAERGDFKIGDRIRVAGVGPAKEYTLVGLARLGGSDTLGGASLAAFTLPEAQRISAKVGEFDQISVAAAESTSPEELKRNLEVGLPDNIEAETGAENTQSQKDDVGEFLGFLKTALLVFAGVSLFVAAFLIFNTFSITIAQRTREFAMLRTLGANRRQILTTVISEAFVVGLVASVVGMLLGFAFAPAINALFKALEIDLPSTGTVIAARTIIVSLLVGTLLTVAASVIPAVRATRVPPVMGLREGVVLETPKGHRRRAAIAVALTGLGIALLLLGVFGVLDPGEAWVGVGAFTVFIGVALLSPQLVKPLAAVVGRPLERTRGISGRLARENSIRNPGRTAATAAVLMIGLTLVSFVAIFAAGFKSTINEAFDETVRGDVILQNQNFSDIPRSTADAVRKVDGVEVASPLSFGEAEVGPKQEKKWHTLANPETSKGLLTLRWEEGDDDVLANLGPNDAVVDQQWAKDNDLAVGDKFTSTTVTSAKIDYTIRGTYEDRAEWTGAYLASDAHARDYNQQDEVSIVLLNVRDGANVDAVRADIDRLLKQQYPNVESQNQQEFKDSFAAELNTLLGVVYALLALAVIVSLFGIVNTLALSIHERTRELGLLRAVGMSRRQVRRVVRWESVITALIGATLGAILGVIFALVMSRPLADEGFTLSIPVGTLILLLIFAMLAGVVAAIGPARRASRLDVLKALAYE